MKTAAIIMACTFLLVWVLALTTLVFAPNGRLSDYCSSGNEFGSNEQRVYCESSPAVRIDSW